MPVRPEGKNLEPDEFQLNNANVEACNQGLFLDDSGDVEEVLRRRRRQANVLSSAPYAAELKSSEDSFDIQSIADKSKLAQKSIAPPIQGVKRDSFGYFTRIEPLPVAKEDPKECDNPDLRDVLLNKRKSDKDEVKRSERKGDKDDFGRKRDKTSPYSYRRHSRTPSPRRQSRFRRSRSRSRERTPERRSPDRRSRDPRNRSREYDRERDKKEDAWRMHMVEPPRAHQFVPMAPAPYHVLAQPGPPPPGTEVSMNVYTTGVPVTQQQVPAPPAQLTGYTPGYPPGYDLYYQRYPPPQPHPQTEYIPSSNTWQHVQHVQQERPPAAAQAETVAKKEAIQKEALQQKITLSKQRDEYLRKEIVLNRELELLKEQKKVMVADKSRDSEKAQKENAKLQAEACGKIKAVENVIEMLTKIIGDNRPQYPLDETPQSGASGSPVESKPTRSKQKHKKKERSGSKSSKKKYKRREKSASGSSDSSTDESDAEHGAGKKKSDGVDDSLAPPGTEVSPTSDKKEVDSKKRCNYVYYDPEMHWCKACDEFPRTAKEYLNHLHSLGHKQMAQERKLNDTPWHDDTQHQEVPFYEGAPTKRTPIRGLQFFVSATAWFCKLCNVWIGDLHCASLHLKSKDHSANYSNFTEQNPHWETDWMAGREKAYEKCAEQKRKLRDEELLHKQKQEHMELLKKQEEELKQKFLPKMMKQETESSSLVMPLTIPRTFEGPALPVKAEVVDVKEEKKRKKKEKNKKEHKKKEKGKKKKRKRSKSSSDSSSSNSSGSSSDESGVEKEDGNVDLTKSVRTLMRNTLAPQPPAPPAPPMMLKPPEEPFHVTMPEKSKWELQDPAVETVKQSDVKSTPDTKVVEKSKPRDWEWSRNTEEDRYRDEIHKRGDQRRSYRGRDRDDDRRFDRDRDSYRDRDRKRGRYERGRYRSRSRSRSRERVTPGVIPAPLYDLFRPEVEKNKLDRIERIERPEPVVHEPEETESKFEKQAVEAAKKKKAAPVMSLPKSKFGFIGRMPFAKKRGETKDDKKKDDEVVEAPPPPRITGPPPTPDEMKAKPVLTSKTKVDTAKDIVYKCVMPGYVMPQMPMDPVIMEVDPSMPQMHPPPPPPGPPSPPPPPHITDAIPGKKTAKKLPSGAPLPQDFQDALSIIYPEDHTMSFVPGPVPGMPYPYIGYMMPPAPPKDPPSPTPPPPPDNLFESNFGLGSSAGGGIPGLEEAKNIAIPDEDMALLGIDAEDMVVQKLI